MLGYALFTAVLLVIANLIVDVMYAVLDPPCAAKLKIKSAYRVHRWHMNYQ